MLKHLIAISLKHATLVVLASALLVLLIGLNIRSLPVDVFPELNAPTVVVLTEAGGLAADEVETSVTFPIEAAVNGLPGSRRIRSASATGLSIVWVEFDWGANLYQARQMVTERLDSAREALPEGTHAEITPITSITGEVMLIALSSPEGKASPLEVRAHAEFEVTAKLRSVAGVAQVVAIGGELPQYQIDVRQDRLQAAGLTLTDIADAARAAHSTAAAGYLPNVQNQELPVRQGARVTGVEDIRSTLVTTRHGTPITIGQIADVRLGAAPARGTASDGAKPAVVISIQKSPGVNTLALTRAIDTALDEIDAGLPAGMVLNRDVFRASHFINRSVHNVLVVSRDAAIIVSVILILFLLNVRATVITLAALPLSVGVALLALWALGLSLNVMTLGGLAVAIGVLVDDAIIDVENVLRRLRENAQLPPDRQRPVLEVIFSASNEIRSAMVFATVIIVMVFVPLLFLEGLEGRFFRPLGVTYIVSIVASLVVALTVTPALCLLLWRGSPLGRRGGSSPGDSRSHESVLITFLKRIYRPLLERSLKWRRAVMGAAALATAGAMALGSTFGSSFLPTFDEGTFTIFLMAPAGTSLAESNRLAEHVERRLIELEGVRGVTRRTGRAERDEHAEPVSSSEIEVTVLDGYKRDEVRRRIDEVVSNIPGITTMIGQPIEHRLSHILSGTPAAIAINIYGSDLETLRSLARQTEEILRQTPGTSDINASREVMVTSVPIRYRHADLAAAGLTPADAAEQVQRAVRGETVAEVSHGIRRYEIVVRLAADERIDFEDLAMLRLHGESGREVRLEHVADIGLERTSNLIARENAQRKAVVSCNVAEGFNLGQLVREVQRRVDPIAHRAGCSVHYGGQFEAQQSALRTILTMGAVVVATMFLLLQVATGSGRVAGLVLVNLPLAVIGGIAAIYITESPSIVGNTLALFGMGGTYTEPVVSIASIVGFITLFGIAVRNGVLLVNHYAHLRMHDGADLRDSIVRGSLERLSPILMTALCAALGLLPLAIAGARPGSELLAPLAVVVLGGLLSSTILNLFVVPAGYAILHGYRTRGQAATPGRRWPIFIRAFRGHSTEGE